MDSVRCGGEFCLSVLAPSAYLAALACPVGEHPAQTFPVALIDTRAHVAEPAATRYKVNEQASAVTDHLAALVLFPAMPPEVIRWDIEISQRAALRPARGGL